MGSLVRSAQKNLANKSSQKHGYAFGQDHNVKHTSKSAKGWTVESRFVFLLLSVVHKKNASTHVLLLGDQKEAHTPVQKPNCK